MGDDEVNDLIQILKDAGVSPAQVRRTLVLLGQAQELSDELTANLGPDDQQEVKKTVGAALAGIFAQCG